MSLRVLVSGLLATLLLLLVVVTPTTSLGTVVQTLPGYTGTLPFHLETGYINVGVNDEVNYFYYFVESEGSPSTDPLLLWITGGPACSSIHAFFYQNGPLFLKYGEWDGKIPKLFDNPYAWTKNLSVIYLDGPVGTGFSYSNTTGSAQTSDTLFSVHAYEFLVKWLEQYQTFKTNQLYIAGDGYSGIPIPLMVQNIVLGNEQAEEPINLKGYVLGSPGTDRFIDFTTRAHLAHQLGFIPTQLFQLANASSNGNFSCIWLGGCDSSNSYLSDISDLVSNINTANVLDASCKSLNLSLDSFVPSPLPGPGIEFPVWCRKEFDFYADVWVNGEGVKEALHVDQKGLDSVWQYCANDSFYDKDMATVIPVHKNLSSTNLRVLIYSGDHDMDVPYIGTEMWLESLELPSDKWRVWSVDNETAGFTRTYQKDDFSLTFATVKGAGHFAPQYKTKECSALMSRWMAGGELVTLRASA